MLSFASFQTTFCKCAAMVLFRILVKAVGHNYNKVVGRVVGHNYNNCILNKCSHVLSLVLYNTRGK